MYTGNIIDTHMHLWDLKNHYPWLMSDVPVLVNLGGNYDLLKKNFLVDDYSKLTKNQNITKSIHVEAFGFEGDPVLETKWLQQQADQYGFPHGIVAHAELQDHNVEEILKQHCQYPNVRGIRMALNYHENPLYQMATRGDYLKDKQWHKGYSLLAKYNLVFDLQVFDSQLDDAVDLIKKYPDVQVVIEHFGWPLDISEPGFKQWQYRMALMAEYPNVFIKLSALGWVFKNSEPNVLQKYIVEAIKLFGLDRCMFGSNFPPDSLFYSFDNLLDTFKKIVSVYSEEQQFKLFYGNAARIYRL